MKQHFLFPSRCRHPARLLAHQPHACWLAETEPVESFGKFVDTQVCRLTIGYWTRRSDDRISLLGMAVGSGRTISRSTPYGVCQTPGRCKSCDESFIESAGSGAAAGNSRKNSDHLAGLYAGQPDDQIICLVRNLNGCAYSETRLIHQ